MNSTITKERGIHNEEERKNIFRPWRNTSTF